jgi:hypothetical protein
MQVSRKICVAGLLVALFGVSGSVLIRIWSWRTEPSLNAVCITRLITLYNCVADYHSQHGAFPSRLEDASRKFEAKCPVTGMRYSYAIARLTDGRQVALVGDSVGHGGSNTVVHGTAMQLVEISCLDTSMAEIVWSAVKESGGVR